MFSSNLTKFSASLALIFLLFPACGWWQNSNNTNSSAAPPVSDDLKSEIPFSTREPEKFQAEIVVTANGIERRTFIARSGANRRWDFNFGAKNQLTSLQIDKNYLILPARRIYAETATAETVSSDDWTDFLTTEWLSQTQPADLEKMETVENLTKYRVRTDDGAPSEIIVYVDEKIGLPVKQEFYVLGDAQKKTLTYSFELKNLKLDTDAELFAVPADFKKVAPEEFRKTLRNEK
jgi:hypothetical protein